MLVVIVAALAIGGLYSFMKFTFLGKALRAVSQDRETAGLMGINENFLIALTIIIASALAGMAGALLASVGQRVVAPLLLAGAAWTLASASGLPQL